MAKGILKVSKTNKGKIFVELDKLNGKPPMPLSYVVFSDTSLNGIACEYETDAKGIFMSIKVEGNVVWSRTPAPTANAAQGQNTNGLSGDSKFQDSFSMPNTFLPKDVRQIGFTDIDNFLLKLQKAARYEVNLSKDNYKFTFYKNDQRDKVFFEIKANYGHLKDNFDALCKRQTQQVERLFPNNSRKIMLQPQWRFILGLGGESVYETNMTLHPNYGIPYLPSSSIKGVLRSWVISQIFAALENVPSDEQNDPLVNAEYRAITGSKLFCAIFGCPKEVKKVIFKDNEPLQNKKGEYVYDNDAGHLNFNAFKKEEIFENRRIMVAKAYQGIITFFDGFPTVAPQIKTDVMNVHYKDWYKDIGYQPPTDTQKTNPIHFLTVCSDNHLQFQTHISTVNGVTLKEISSDYGVFIKGSNLSADAKLLDLIKYWLEKALSEHGIGAKTAVGYGYFKV